MEASFPSGEKWPRCKFCKDGITRPNTLLFGDANAFIEHPNVVRGDDYRTWTQAVIKSLKENPQLKLVIVEIGCGIRVIFHFLHHNSYRFLPFENDVKNFLLHVLKDNVT